MTTFEDLERGDVVWGTDPLSDKGRPMLILGTPRFQNHGVQLITVLISTKTYHEDALMLSVPRTAAWIADEALVAENTARGHLQRLSKLNVLRADTDGEATTYFPDPVYVHTREVRALVDDHDRDDLTALAVELKADIEAWEREFDATDPDDVRLGAVTETTSAAETRERRRVASDWEHAQYRLSLVEDALARYGEFSDRPAPA